MPGRVLAAVLLVVATAAGCADSDAPSADAVAGVAACDDLRRRENELISVANEALADLADAADDAGRAEALQRGYDRLVALLSDQVPASDVEPAVHEHLVAGAEDAVAGLEDERDEFAGVATVTQADEHGRAGQLQTALEKVFSDLEPPRSVYAEAGLADAIDADPDCTHVTQRGDPAE